MRIRFARPRDRRGVAARCRRAVGRDDYVLRLLDDVIRDGGLLVAFEGTRAVAMMNSIEVTDGSLWLSMARTDPRHQGRGAAAAPVVRRFSRQAILRRLGRTWVASPHALKPGEFEWFEFAVLRGDAAEALREGARLAHAPKAQRAFNYLPPGKAYL